MLSMLAVDAVSIYADSIIKTDRAIAAIPNTPLGSLVAASTGPITDGWAAQVRDADDVDGMSIAIGSMLVDTSKSCTQVCPESQHSITKSEKILMMTAGITAVIKTASNIASPLIADIYKNVANQMDSVVNDVGSGVSVRIDTYAGIWYSSVLETTLERFQGTFKIQKSLKVHKELSPEELMELLSNHSGRFQSEIDDWIESVGIDLVSSVYHDLLLKSDHGFTDLSNMPRDYCLAYFLLVHSLINADIQEGINMDMNTYKEEMGKCMEYAATVCNSFIQTRAREKNQGILVRSYPPMSDMYRGGCDIVVNGDIYNDWLEQGGCPDAVLGAFVSSRTVFFKEISEKCDELAAVWQDHLRKYADHQRSIRLTNIRTFLRDVIESKIFTMQDNEFVHGSPAEYKQRLTDTLSNVYINRIDDLYGIVRDTVCQVFFPKTDVHWILNTMDSICKDEPTADPRKVASIVTLHYITRWVACQIKSV